MKRLILAIKVFFKAFRDPKGASLFLEGKKSAAPAPSLEHGDSAHLRLLAMLQQSSRLIDFIKEDLSSFDDAQVGAAVRKIHTDCGACLEELVTIRPVMDDREGAKITVPQGYDPTKIKVLGKVKGEPPFVGVLVHKGWKAHKRSLPKKVGGDISDVIAPAEVEVR